MLGGGDDKTLGLVRWRGLLGGVLVQVKRERERDHFSATYFQFLQGRVCLSPVSGNGRSFSGAGDGITHP
jgi:hypothetical protein